MHQFLPIHIMNDILKTANQPFHILSFEINAKNAINHSTTTILIMRAPHPNVILLKNLSCWSLYRYSVENY